MVQTTEISKYSSTATGDEKTGKRRSTLRPPTLMIDLLFGALMLFAFQMGYVDKAVVTHDIKLPTSTNKKDKERKNVLPVTPVRGQNGNWSFKLAGGKILSTNEVVKELKKSGKTPVISLPAQTRIQTYMDASDVLRSHGFKPILHVNKRKG